MHVQPLVDCPQFGQNGLFQQCYPHVTVFLQDGTKSGGADVSQTMHPTAVVSSRQLGTWVKPWHVVAAFAAMAAAFWALKTEAVATLRELAVNKAYFDSGHPLLFDSAVRGYTADQAREHLTALGNAACFYYGDTYIALYDLVFPLLLLVFGVLFILYATQPGKSHALSVTPLVQRLLLAVPVALFVFDMGENLFVHSMLEMQPAVNAKLVETASMFTQLKWLAAFIEGALLTGLVAYTAHKLVEGEPGRRT